uniref:Uncharacterized protein n=1 Tax=mine drainage metagenome TaxID=410659 RepID=E6QA67_9ZZZZ
MELKKSVGARLGRSMLGVWLCGALSTLDSIFNTVAGGQGHLVQCLMMAVNLLTVFFALHAAREYWSSAADDPEVRKEAALEMYRNIRAFTEPARRAQNVIIRWRKNCPFSEIGAIGNISKARAKAEAMTSHPCGRQAGPASKSRRQASGTKSSSDPDGDGGDSDPTRSLIPSALLQQLEASPRIGWSYNEFSNLFGSSPKTLRNKVSRGEFPPPIKTALGVRFTSEHLRYALDPDQFAPKPAKRGRGRPRIAEQRGKGGVR